MEAKGRLSGTDFSSGVLVCDRAPSRSGAYPVGVGIVGRKVHILRGFRTPVRPLAGAWLARLRTPGRSRPGHGFRPSVALSSQPQNRAADSVRQKVHGVRRIMKKILSLAAVVMGFATAA